MSGPQVMLILTAQDVTTLMAALASWRELLSREGAAIRGKFAHDARECSVPVPDMTDAGCEALAIRIASQAEGQL